MFKSEKHRITQDSKTLTRNKFPHGALELRWVGPGVGALDAHPKSLDFVSQTESTCVSLNVALFLNQNLPDVFPLYSFPLMHFKPNYGKPKGIQDICRTSFLPFHYSLSYFSTDNQ